ncbi:MAG: hypothetical protein U1E06_25155 [Tabrizicola sp.]|uniref:hypothetical protein n=1 Tax=Tabrizicola sp. TaxID=2005166 RepID=UPI002734B477|nr:hypothetical protein [Tabrizicola sp.]MDP3263032.1 hypothetical protein [Tabrizicola sp.]MDP3648567.1 hypothetical protein [Paracoccaceae bacterium]MDZ4070092.1 hypothetical protein [Tabrizicola sp.]
MTVKFLRPLVGVMLASVALQACTPTVPDSGSGVGFQDYNSYIRGAQPSATPSMPVVVPPVGRTFDPAAAAAAIDRAEGLPAPVPTVAPGGVQGGVIGANVGLPDSTNRPRGGAPAGIKEESGEMIHNNTGISDEQDFGAVSSRETIESDKERIARNRSEYVVVQPTDLPQRPGDTGPNIVEYALATKHAPGVQLYQRRSIVKRDPVAACAKFTSPDIAQQEFLKVGGPERDRLGVDPDGDGFACTWDPRPFRTALQ